MPLLNMRMNSKLLCQVKTDSIIIIIDMIVWLEMNENERKHIRVVSNAKSQNFLGPIPKHCREYVKQIKEDGVSQAIANFRSWNPNHFQTGIHTDSFIHNIGEFLQ